MNAGSTSLKLRIVERDDRVTETVDCNPPGDSLEDDLRRFLASAGPLDAIGHRVVHGGPRFTRPVVIDASIRAQLEEMNDLAPLHNPPALAAIDALRHLSPNVPAVACFDTAFHTSLKPAASSYALPTAWVERWRLRRYGFHGLSCEWSASRAAALLERPVDSLRLVICHLGGGASVTATAGGRSVDTTMGFTPTEGLVMATRPGDVDPGAIAWVAAHGVAPHELADALERQSGLLALSGGTYRRYAGAASASGAWEPGSHPGGRCLCSSPSGEDRCNDRRHGRDGRRGVYGGCWRERGRNTGQCVRAPRMDRSVHRRGRQSGGRFRRRRHQPRWCEGKDPCHTCA